MQASYPVQPIHGAHINQTETLPNKTVETKTLRILFTGEMLIRISAAGFVGYFCDRGGRLRLLIGQEQTSPGNPSAITKVAGLCVSLWTSKVLVSGLPSEVRDPFPHRPS